MSTNYLDALRQAAADQGIDDQEVEETSVDYSDESGLTPTQKLRKSLTTAGADSTESNQDEIRAMEEAVKSEEAVYGNDFASIKDYLGEEGLNYETQDLEDMRAWSVSGTEKASKFVGRALGKAITATGEGVALLGGLAGETAEAIAGTLGDAEGKEGEFNMEGFVNNSFVKLFNELDEDIKSTMPVYHRKAIEEGTLMTQLSSGEFWASEGADGVGFLLSALAPGAAIKAVGLGAKTGIAINSLGQHYNWGKVISVGSKMAANGDIGAATVLNTIIEAGIEAGSTGRGLESYYAKQVENGSMSVNEAEEAKAITMGKIFTANALLLLGPNLLQNTAIFKAMTPGKGVADDIIKAMKEGAETSSKATFKGTLKKGKDIAKPFVEQAVAEGFIEEGGQFALENYFTKEAKGETDAGILEGVAGEYIKGFSTIEGQKSMALGAILGAGVGGVQTFRSNKAKAEANNKLAGVLGKNKETLEHALGDLIKKNPKTGEPIITKTGEAQLDPIKALESIDKAINSEEAFATLNKYIATNNKEGEQFALNEIITKFVMPYAGIDGGMELLEGTIDDLVEGVTKNVGESSRFTKEQLKDTILKKAKEVTKQTDYMSLYGDNFFKIRLPEDGNTEYNKAAKNTFLQKLQTAGILNESRQSLIKERITDLEQQREEIFTKEGVSFSDVDEKGRLLLDEEIFGKMSAGAAKISRNISTQIYQYRDSIKKLNEEAKLIFDKKEQQKAFEDYLSSQKDLVEQLEKIISSTEEDPEAFRGNEEDTEEQLAYISNTFKKLVDLETLTIKDREERVMHSSEFSITAEGLEDTLHKPGENNYIVIGKSKAGNLSIKNTVTGKLGYINKNGSVYINGKEYAGFTPDINISKEDIRKERQGDAFLQVMEDQISFLEEDIKVFDKRVESNLGYITALKDKIKRALDNTKKLNKGKRKNLKEGRVQLRIAGKTILQTAAQLEDRLNIFEDIIEDAKSKKENRLQRIEAIKQKRDDVINDVVIRDKVDNLDLEAFGTASEDMQALADNYTDLIDKAEKEIVAGRSYINKLNSLMKGLYTSFKKMFDSAYPEYQGLLRDSDIEKKRAIVRHLQSRKGEVDLNIKDLTDDDLMMMSEEDLDNAITSYHKANYDFDLMGRDDFDLVALEDEDFDNMIYRDLKVTKNLLEEPIFSKIYENISNILNKIELKESEIAQLEAELETLKRASETVNRSLKTRKSYLDKYYNAYTKYILDNNLIYDPNEDIDDKDKVEDNTEDEVTETSFKEAEKAVSRIDNIDKKELVAPKFTGDISDFLKTQSSQKEETSSTKRWFSWLEKYTSAGAKKQDEEVATRFIAYSVHNLPKELHDKVSFYVENEDPTLKGTTMLRSAITGDMLSRAENDIKLLVYRKDKNEHVTIKGKPVYSSMPAASYEFPSKDKEGNIRQRFSYSYKHGQFTREYLDTIKNFENFPEKQKKEAEKNAEKYADNKLTEIKEKVLSDYKDLRESIIKGKPVEFRSTGKNPGVKGETNGYISPLGTISGTIKQLGKQIVIIAEKETQNYNGINYRTFKGQAYVHHQGRLVLLKPKTLAETGDIPRIIRIIQHLSTMPSTNNEEKNAKKEINAYLRTMVHMNKNDNKFKFLFTNGYQSLHYGGKTIATKDLLDNQDIISDVSKFLEDKHHNISKEFLGKKEYYYMDVENGKLKRKKLHTEGYTGYILANTTSVELGPLGNPASPQFLNTSLKLKTTDSTYIPKSEKEEKEKKEEVKKDKREKDLNKLKNLKKGDKLPARTKEGGFTIATVVESDGIEFTLKADVPLDTPGGGIYGTPIYDNVINDYYNSLLTKDTTSESVSTPANAEEFVEAFEAGQQVGLNRAHKKGTETVIFRKEGDEVVIVDRILNGVSDITKLGTINVINAKLKEMPIEQVLFEKESREAIKVIDTYIYTAGTTAPSTTKEDDRAIEASENTLAKLLGSTGAKGPAIGTTEKSVSEKEEAEKTGKNTPPKTASHYKPSFDSIKSSLKPSQSKENLIESIKWFKQKFPNINIEVVKELIDEYSEGRLTHEGKVLISELSTLGTTYHEAFHVVSRLFMTPQQRAGLYAEAEKMAGKKMSEKEAEEYLAEEFRSFMLSDGKYNFPKDTEETKNLFQKIWEYLKSFFNKYTGKENESPYSIEKVFRDIASNNTYKGEGNIKGIAEDYDSRILHFDYTQSSALMKDFNNKFFGTLLTQRFGYNKVGPEAIMNYESNIGEVYDYIKNEVILEEVDGVKVWRGDSYDSSKDNISKLLNEFYYNNFDEMVTAHKKYMRQYNISIKEDEKIEEDSKGKDSSNYAESNKQSVKDLLPQPIKILIAGLPSLNEHFYPKLTTKEIGGVSFQLEEAVNYTKTLNNLNNILAGASSYSEMLKRLASKSAKHPEYRVLIDWLGSTPSKEITDTATKDTLELQKQFYKFFSKNKNIPLIAMIQESGEVSISDALDVSMRDRVLEVWKNNVKNNSSSTFFKNKGGKLVLDINDTIRISGDVKVKYGSITQGQLSNWSDKDVKNLLYKFGIDLSKAENIDEIPVETIRDTAAWLVGELSNLTKVGNEITPDDIFSKSVVDINSKINALADQVAGNIDEDVELSYFNQDGKREYVITLNTHISKSVNALNSIATDIIKGDIVDEVASLKMEKIMPYNPKTRQGNLFTRGSKWLSKVTEGRNSLRVGLLKGVKSLAENKGSEVSSLDKHSMRYLHTNALLSGYFPLLRSADRSLEYAFKFAESDNLSNYSKKEFIKQMSEYLADELTTIAAFKNNGTGSELKNVSEVNKDILKATGNKIVPGEHLRFFKEIIDPAIMKKYEQALLKGKKNKLDPTVIADSFIKDNYTEVASHIRKWLTKETKNNLNLLKESKIVESYDLKNKNYKAKGIKKEAIDSIFGKGNREVDKQGYTELSEEDALLIAEIITARYTEGANEQLRLFLGDIAHYKSVADFHKRVTGAASTKEDLRLGEEFNNKLGEFYKRLDGKPFQNHMRKVIVKDVNVTSEQLSDYEEAFLKSYDKQTAAKYLDAYKAANIEEADAQTRTTLDAYRELKLRGEEWTNEDETTYQYEMQQFFKRASKVRPEKYTEELFQELFEEHIPEGTTLANFKTPYFQKETIDEYVGLKPMPPLKLQGFGFIDSVNNLAATDFTKTSVSPIIPSSLPIGSPMFNHLLDMIDNQIDMEVMESGSKGDKLTGTQDYYNENGTIYNVVEDQVQDHSLVGFGFQQKIDTKIKEKATLSTQKESLEFVDLFKQGELTEEILPEEVTAVQDLKDKKIKAKSALIKINRESLLRKLNLKEENGKYILKGGGVEKLKAELKRAFTQRDMPDNIVEGLDLALSSEGQLLDTLSNKGGIESVLMSLVRNEVIRQKVNGGMYVQEASTGLEPETRENIKVSNYLKSYRVNRKDKDGNLEDARYKEGDILPSEIEIAVPKSWLPWVKTLKAGSLNGLDALNYMIENRDPKISKQLLDLAGNRIPAQGINSMESFTIKRFLPYHVGAKVIVPTEIVAKAGSDYDIDKLTLYLPAFKLDKEGKPYYIASATKTNKVAAADRYYNRIQSDIKELLSDDTLLDEEGNIVELKDINSRYALVYNKLLAHHPSIRALTTRIAKATKEADIKKLTKQREAEVQILHRNFTLMGTASPHSKFVSQEMAKEFSLITLEEFESLPLEEQLSKEELENQIMEVTKDVLLLKSNFANLMRPIDADTLKGLANEEGMGAKTGFSTTDLLSWGYNLQVGENNWAGAAGVGMAAVQTTSHSYTQQSPIKIQDPVVRLYIKTEEGSLDNQEYEMGHTKDAGGNIISNTFGEFISAFVDVARDPFIKRINGGEAFNVYSFLQRVGTAKGGRPMSIRQAAYFLTQPIILEYLDAKAKNSAFFNKDKVFKKDVVNGILAEYNISGIEAKNMEWANYQEYLESGVVETMTDVQESLGYIPLTVDMLHPNNRKKLNSQTQLQILDNFLTYELYAQQLSDFNKGIKVDTGLPGNRSGIKAAKLAFKELMKQGFWSPSDITRLFNNTVLKEYKNTRDTAVVMYNNFFLTDKHAETFDQLFETILDRFKNKSQKDIDKISQKVENIILEYALHTEAGYTGKSLNEEYDSLIKTGDSSVARRLAGVKKIIGENIFLDQLVPMLNDFESRRGRNIGVDYVKIYSRKMTTEESNTMTGSFLELIEHKNPTVSKFAQDLVKLSLMQSGLGNSHITFATIIPNEFYQKYTNDLLDNFSKSIPTNELAKGELLEDIEDIFYRNNWSDTTIVPRAKDFYSEMYKKLLVPITKEGELKVYGGLPGGPKYMTYAKKIVRENSSKYKEVTGFNTKEEILFKDSGEVRKIGKWEYNIYTPVSKLGHGNKFLEVPKGPTSVLEANNKNYTETGSNVTDTTAKSDMASLDNYNKEELSEGTYQKLSNFLGNIGVEIKEVEEILDRNGNIILDASGIARLSSATVELLKGSKGLKQLPEEASHFYVAMLGNDSNLYKSMYDQIVNYPVYQETLEKYKDMYGSNERLYREEAIGQLIAEHIAAISNGETVSEERFTDRQIKQVDNWWKALWASVRKMFTKATTDPYTQGALEILENDLSSMETKRAEDFIKEEVTEITTPGINMEYTEKIAKIQGKIKNKEEAATKNNQQLSKVNYKRISEYSDFFPGFDALTEAEAAIFMRGVENGDIEIACKL